MGTLRHNAICLVFLVILGGCVGPEAPGKPHAGDESEATGMGSPSQAGPSTSNHQTMAQAPARLHLDGCRSMGAIADVPTDPTEGPPRPAWQTTQEFVGTLRIDVFQCQRVGYGGLERTNVSMAFEIHNFISPPDACFGPSARIMWALWRWHLSDAALAAALANATGAPAQFLAIQSSVAQESDQAISHWQGGQMDDNVHFDFSAPQIPAQPTSLARYQRFAWAYGENGVAMLDMTDVVHSYEASPEASWGTVGPDTLFGRGLGARFAGIGTTYYDVDSDAYFATFADAMCEEPVAE